MINPVFDYMKTEGSLITALPVLDFDTIRVYELALATTEFRFYSDMDDFLMLDTSGEIITNYENFYTSALFEEYEKIQTGETQCLYIDPDVEEYLNEETDDDWD